MLPLLYSLNTHNMESGTTQPTVTTQMGIFVYTDITIAYAYSYNYVTNKLYNARPITQEVAIACLN